MMNKQIYNPDVLLTLANLSNDEVFTSPDLANKLLDLLPDSIWKDKNATFLDPVSKTGVFLREITKRLINGLEQEIPDLQERINHILVHQVFGIAITELTSLMSKRTLYCSKKADGKYSIATAFDRNYGNIYFPKTEHTWKSGRCIHCGASQEQYKRAKELESHAYAFIHKKIPKEFKDMKFDVIIGNPPYQLSDGGAQSSAMPLYHKFVEQAKKLNPRYLTMIIPSRWFSGGKGLDSFRSAMLSDKRIRVLSDYFNAAQVFPGVEIKGGVCFFLWDRDNSGNARIITHNSNGDIEESSRPLLEDGSDVFIRYQQGVDIYRKVKAFNEQTFDSIVSSRKPFGFPTNFEGKKQAFEQSIVLYGRLSITYIDKKQISRNLEWINKYKILISKAYNAGDTYPHQIINKPLTVEKNTACTETYLVIGPFESSLIMENVKKYIETKFFRFMVFLRKNSQDATSKVYSFVPKQDFNKPWTDRELYQKYNLNEQEIDFIEAMIKSMGDIEEYDVDGEDDE